MAPGERPISLGILFARCIHVAVRVSPAFLLTAEQ